MSNKEKIVLSWSGGKDCAMALYKLLQDKNYAVVALLTSVSKEYDRISMHGVRVALLEQQAAALNLPVHKIMVSSSCSCAAYEKSMLEILLKLKEHGISTVAFGDIFLQDLREYREQQLAKINGKAIFPLRGCDTKELMDQFLTLGFQAVTTCVDTEKLALSFVGRYINKEFLQELPAIVDPCGENGEFHSFVTSGPMFKKKINIQIGKQVSRDNFCFCDIFIP